MLGMSIGRKSAQNQHCPKLKGKNANDSLYVYASCLVENQIGQKSKKDAHEEAGLAHVDDDGDVASVWALVVAIGTQEPAAGVDHLRIMVGPTSSSRGVGVTTSVRYHSEREQGKLHLVGFTKLDQGKKTRKQIQLGLDLM